MPIWNAITNARVGSTCLAGLALVILSASLAEAVFGPRTTIGKNYQQWSSTESTDGINPGNCNNIGCFVVFQAIPQQQPLIVQHVTCRAGAFGPPIELEVVQLGTRKGQDINLGKYSHLVPVPTADGWWAVNSPVMHLLKSGERPYVRFFSATQANWSVECSISGKLQ